MSHCPSREQLDRFLHDVMDQAEESTLVAHVDECPVCSALLEQIDPLNALTTFRGDETVAARLRETSAEISETSNLARLNERLRQVPEFCQMSSGSSTGSAAPDDDVLEELETVDKYEVGPVLGRGGMGTVYLGFDRDLGREVAVKVLASNRSADQHAIDLARSEMKAVGRLNHPNVVGVMNAGMLPDGRPFLVMEYLRGTDLESVVRGSGPLSPAEACEYLAEAADGLQHAHERGLIHRDIKPSNLFRTTDGTIKVLDFGLAYLNQEQMAEGGVSQSGLVMGTVDYMPPEQAADPRRADNRSDIYSLGCTLHWLLTGRRVYRCDTPTQVLFAHRDKPIPHLSELLPEVPTGLDDVFRRMVAKSPDERYQSMAQVARELRRFVNQIDPVPPTIDLEPVRRQPGPRRGTLLSGAAAFLLLLGIIITLKIQQDRIELEVKQDGTGVVSSTTISAEGNAATNNSTKPSPTVATKNDAGTPAVASQLEVTRDTKPDGVIQTSNLADDARDPQGDISSLGFFDDGERIALTVASHLEVWKISDLAHPERIWQVESGSKEALKALVISRDQSSMITAGLDGIVRRFQVGEAGPAVSEFRTEPVRRGILTLAMTADESILFDGSYHFVGGQVHAVAMPGQTVLKQFNIEPMPGSDGSYCGRLSLAPDQKWLAAGSRSGRVVALNLPDLTLRSEFQFAERIDALVVTPDSRRIVAAGWPEDVQIRDAQNGELIGTIPGTEKTLSLAITPDGEWLFAATSNQLLHVIRMSDVKSRSLHRIPVSSETLALSRDGKLLAASQGLLSGYGNGQVAIWKTSRLTDKARPVVASKETIEIKHP